MIDIKCLDDELFPGNFHKIGFLLLFGIAGKIAQYHAPNHAHQASKRNLPLFCNKTKEDHLCGNPKHQISFPAREKLTFHSGYRLLNRQSLYGTGECALHVNKRVAMKKESMAAKKASVRKPNSFDLANSARASYTYKNIG